MRLLPALLVVALIPSPVLAVDAYLSHPAVHGDRLVFASEGDLWIATLPSDPTARVAAHRLTSGAGSESHPVLSPDGTKVAFAAEFEGNRDVYVMSLAGGAPLRITFHPADDVPLAWTPDGTRIAIRSPRGQPFGRPELFLVDATGGPAEPVGIGECAQLSFDPRGGGTRFALCRWSNEQWNWKRYRGGTAPEIWSGDLATDRFVNLTGDRANDLFPMWIGDRIAFASDRDGVRNIWSMSQDGQDLRQHTRYTDDATRPTDPDTYELRWPSADAAGGRRIVFAQGGGLVLLDLEGDRSHRLSIDVISDRPNTRPRFVDALANATAFSLAPRGDRLLVEARGELLVLPVGKPKPGVPIGARQITQESAGREWGAVWLSEETVACVSDTAGEQQIALLPADGSATLRMVTTDLSQWILKPVASPDGRHVAFGDKELRLRLVDVVSGAVADIDRSSAGEIDDYAFSPDGSWIAWSVMLESGFHSIRLRPVAGGDTIELSDGLSDDRRPRFDPKGRYLWFLSDRHLDPLIAGPDFEFVLPARSVLCAVPLESATPPPAPLVAAAAGFDLKAWAKAVEDEEGADEDAEEKEQPAKDASSGKESDDEAFRIETDGIARRIWRSPVPPGNYVDLAPTYGGAWILSEPARGIADDPWPAPPLGLPIRTLHRFDALEGKTEDVVEGIGSFAADRDGRTVAWLKDRSFTVRRGEGEDASHSIVVKDAQVRVDPAKEWAQMLEETWRLQRDFFWAPNMSGVDWPAMRERYRALLPKIGSRREATDVMGQMIAELGTSHTYLMGGDDPDRVKSVGVGLLGADLRRDGNAIRIDNILHGRPGDEDLTSPLAAPHLEIEDGTVLLSVDGRAVRPDRDPYELLQDRAGRAVVLEIASDAAGNDRRVIEVIALSSEAPHRYDAWVEMNRRAVDEASGGRLGYIHIPDMDSEGLIAFSRLFFPQLEKDGLIVDVRDNGGGYVSQLILARLAREPWAFGSPRHGRIETYPNRVRRGPFVVLIDQHAGSDGDIFPAMVRARGLAPLIGTRTWGGVVGIRADKPSVDLSVSTQPEYAWFESTPSSGEGATAWTIENEGVPPDIEIDLTPSDRRVGRDPQLDRGIEELQSLIRRSPSTRPNPPAFPGGRRNGT